MDCTPCGSQTTKKAAFQRLFVLPQGVEPWTP